MRVLNLTFRKSGMAGTAAGLCLALLLAISAGAGAAAQGVSIPNFWDPGEKIAEPDLSTLQRLRFLTTTDFPPFNFIDRRRRLAGFHVDLARAICAELGILPKCQIQALPWEELEDAMAHGDGDAIIAGLDVDTESRKRFEFSRPYLRIPARFIARRDDSFGEPISDVVLRHKVGLVAGSKHLNWFDTVFRRGQREVFPTRQAALEALQDKRVDLVFSDAVSLSFWLLSTASRDCCAFVGGPYMASASFGQGMAIAFPKGRSDLAAATDYALKEISEKGIFAELYLRYFPLGLY